MTVVGEGWINRLVFVSGGCGALGSAVVSELLAAGATCIVPCLNERERDQAPFRGDDRVSLPGPVDLADERQVVQLFSGLVGLDASIHIAGGFAMSPIGQTSADDMLAMFKLNTLTCFLSCREAVRKMRQSGQGGRIVNVAARPAVQPAGGMLAYTTSKAAVASFTQCLADEVRADGILVNAVLPSIMDTPANRKAMPDADFDAWPKVEEVAHIILDLASPANRVTSGALVPVYGRA